MITPETIHESVAATVEGRKNDKPLAEKAGVLLPEGIASEFYAGVIYGMAQIALDLTAAVLMAPNTDRALLAAPMFIHDFQLFATRQYTDAKKTEDLFSA